MCPPKVDKPDIVVPDAQPRVADEQLALSTRIADETRRRRLAAIRETIATGQGGVLSRATTTKTIATGGVY